MSNFDDSPYDDEDFKQMLQDDPSQLTPEDVFSMVMFNRKRMTKVNVELQDKDGNVIALHEVIEDLLKYINRKLEDAENTNQFADQIYPLMSKILSSGLARLIGIYQTGFYLTQDETRYGFINMMSVSFLLLKYIQQKNLKIITNEEKVTQAELDEIEAKAEYNKQEVLNSMIGRSGTASIKRMLDSGKVSREQLQELLDEQNKDN
jgi:hypothetical protein